MLHLLDPVAIVLMAVLLIVNNFIYFVKSCMLQLKYITPVAAPENSSCRGTTGALQSLTGHTS